MADEGTMGDHDISREEGQDQAQRFTRALLADLTALQRLLEDGVMESGVRRIGAEQEMFLVDRAMRGAPVNCEVLRQAKEPRLTTEIGRFNLEANLSPRRFEADCLSQMHAE